MKKFILKTFGLVMVLVVLASSVITPQAAAAAPNFASGDFVDLVPYMEYETYGKTSGEREDGTQGSFLTVEKSANGFTQEFFSFSSAYGLRFSKTVNRKSTFDLVKEDGTYYIQTTIEPPTDIYQKDVPNSNGSIYSGPALIIGYGECDEYSGYFNIIFSRKDGIDLQFCDKLGNALKYIGGIDPKCKVSYPDTGTKTCGTGSYDVIVEVKKTGFSMWLNGSCVFDDIQFDKIISPGTGKSLGAKMERFDPGTRYVFASGKIINMRLWAKQADVNTSVVNANTANNNNTTTSTGNNSSTSTDNNNSENSGTVSDNENTTESNNNTTDKNKSTGSKTKVTNADTESEFPVVPFIIAMCIMVIGVGAEVAAAIIVCKRKKKFF